MSRAQERSTAIRAERAPAFSGPWGLLAITPTSGAGLPKAKKKGVFFASENGFPFSSLPLNLSLG
jgi:hypothetical protein